MTAPFVKFVGGKRHLLPQILPLVPKHKLYVEPFVGGGAVFFALQPEKAVLSDVNAELINAYSAVRHDLPELVRALGKHANRYAKDGASYFYSIRIHRPKEKVEVAARFIFLNKTCYNGLYRVNGGGDFNVPHGNFKTPPNICDVPTLTAASIELESAIFATQDFSSSFQIAEKNEGSFVYADPPYVPVSATSNFTGYAKSGFTYEHQVRLRDASIHASKKGVKVLISNSCSPIVLELYRDRSQFEIIEVDAKRSVNSDASKRGNVKELLIKTRGW